MADAPGELRIELKLVTGSGGPCDLRLVARRRATAADRARALAERELADGNGRRRTWDPEFCPAGILPLENAQRRFADLGLPRRRAEALLALGLLQKDCLRQNEAALQAFIRLEPLAAGDPALESIVRQQLGELRFGLGDLDGAIGEYRRALELRRRLGDRFGEALTSSTLGHALHLRGRYDEAAALFDRAIALQDPSERAKALLNRGHLHRELGELVRARERFDAALALSRQAKNRDDEAVALSALGLLAQDEGRPGAALEPLRGALALSSPGTRGHAVALTTLGVTYRQLGRKDEARRAYAQALPIFRKLGNAREQAFCLGNLGFLEAATGDDTAALEHLDGALKLFQTLADPPNQAWAQEGKASVLRRRGRLEEARGLMEQALAAVERHRFSQTTYATRAGFFATRQGYYDSLIDLLMEMHGKTPAAGHDAAALQVSERSLARSLLDGLADGGLRTALTQPRPWRADEIQRLLDRDTLLLEYRLGEKRSFLWAITPDSLAAFELPGRAVIEEAALPAGELLARSYGSKAESSSRPRLARLSRLLLDPVAPLLSGKRLVVVGNGILQSLPFAALPEPRGTEPLIARHEIVSLPSASVLGVLRQEVAGRPAAPKTLWVLADPEFGGASPRLPYTRQEAAEILKLAPAGERFAVLGRKASRAAVLNGALRDYRFLHFATHGSFTADDPGGGRLELAQSSFLHLADIYELDLQADLVVLSACQSALGREVKGEGMMGMTRGFFYAGAERVLVSLWNVNDRVAVDLMEHFYRGMLAGGLSPAAALREAQNGIRSQARWRAPYYWAGFTLQGEWRGDRPPPQRGALSFSTRPGARDRRCPAACPARADR